MNNLDKVLKGINLYPVIGEKYLNIVLKINMKEEYKEIFGLDCSFDEFIEDLKKDEFTRFIVFQVLYDYYGCKRMPIITDSSFENWYLVNYLDKVNNPYTLSFVDKIGSMNTYSMMDDYVDLFNNKIEYKMA
ncbi:MAG: hypothetical protein IKQ33_02170 [Clostridia bacterium]|nr:hypothetical protein [Clostridia bacterium]